MVKIIDHRCDSCGKDIQPRDFNYGATKKPIYFESNKKRKEYETICIMCNQNSQEHS